MNENAEKTLLVDGKVVLPHRSLAVVNHSPDGFNWGYGGSGPAQTTLAILLECTSEIEALSYYQDYKREVIASIPQEQSVLSITSKEVEQWLSSKREDKRREGKEIL